MRDERRWAALSEAERKRPGLHGNTCVPRPVRGKRRRCGAKGWEREERWVSGSLDNFRRLSSKRNHRTLLHRGQRQGRVGTFFIKVSFGKRRRVSISFLSIYARHTSLYRHTRNTSMIFPSASIEPRSTDRSIDRWNMEKLSRSVVSKGKRNGRAGHRRRRVPLEREGITISRATSTYSPFVRSTLRVERHRRENGRTKLQRAALHAAKLAIAYYIIHEWRSFRRARIGRATRFLPSPTRLRKTKTTPRPYNLASFSNKLTTYAALRRASLS